MLGRLKSRWCGKWIGSGASVFCKTIHVTILILAIYVLAYTIFASWTFRLYRATCETSDTETIEAPPPITDIRKKLRESLSIDGKGALLAGRPRRTTGYLTLGIPTVRRNKKNYLRETIESLIEHMTETERTENTIVVFLADFEDDSKAKTLRELTNEFHRYMESGLLRVITAPRSFYPNQNVTKRTYNHPVNKVKWRSKQNYDYAFLMKYSESISKYYLQLEDDIITQSGYISRMKKFIDSQKSEWVCLEFSNLGYIGKLYHSSDLDQLAKMLILFYREQPGDVTYLYFNQLLLQPNRIASNPSLFQHRGYYSSLPGKIQRLKDTEFGNHVVKRFQGDNPPATIFSTFEGYLSSEPENAYNKGTEYYRVASPQLGNSITVVFHNPEKIHRIAISTGSARLPNEYLHGGIVEVSSIPPTVRSVRSVCEVYTSVGEFSNEGQFDAKISSRIYCMRITMTTSQIHMIVFGEIAVFVKK